MKGDTKCRNGLELVRVTQGHWKEHQSIEHIWVPISVP